MKSKLRKSAFSLLVLSFFFLLSSHTVSAHKFYMSITEMEYNPQTKSLQVVIKFFIDDIETVLEEKNQVRLLLGSEKEHHEADKYLQNYLNSHFIIEQSRGSLTSTFIGKEVDEDYLWAYLEFKKFKVKDETTLSNTLLIKNFPSQANKVNYKNGSINKSFTLHQSKITEEF